MTPPLWVLPLTVAACWDSWIGYGHRLAPRLESLAAPLVLVVTLVLILTLPASGERPSRPLLVPALLLALHALGQTTLPFLARGAIAIMAVGTVLHLHRWRTLPAAPYWGLFLLSLPIVPSLQFFLGFPARVAAATVTVFLLQNSGMPVTRRGTVLDWGGTMIQFDAPCSGVKMLWAGLFLTLVLAVVHRLNAPRTALALAVCLLLVIGANGLRGASLFFVETGILHGPGWWHEGIGVAVFFLLALTLPPILEKIGRW